MKKWHFIEKATKISIKTDISLYFIDNLKKNRKKKIKKKTKRIIFVTLPIFIGEKCTTLHVSQFFFKSMNGASHICMKLHAIHKKTP